MAFSAISLRYRANTDDPKNQDKFVKIFREFEHSFESLVEIHFTSFPRSWLNKFTNPMPKIESVTFK